MAKETSALLEVCSARARAKATSEGKRKKRPAHAANRMDICCVSVPVGGLATLAQEVERRRERESLSSTSETSMTQDSASRESSRTPPPLRSNSRSKASSTSRKSVAKSSSAKEIWGVEVEAAFQEAIALYPHRGRRKLAVEGEDKLYGECWRFD